MDRNWAVGLSQEEFNIAYERKFPGADVIPDVKFYTTMGEPVYHGISPIRDEEFAPEETPINKDEPKPLPAKIKQPGKFICRGCGQKFDYPIVRWRHEKKCQNVLAEGA